MLSEGDEFDHIDLGMDDDNEKSATDLMREAKGDSKPEDKAATQSAEDLQKSEEKEEPKVKQVESPK
jgi:hypothetical protein